MSDPLRVETARLELPEWTEIHVAARPAPGAIGSAAQIDGAFDALGGALQAHGATPADVVAERLFLRDLGDQAAALAAARRLHGDGPMPATTILEQPPVICLLTVAHEDQPCVGVLVFDEPESLD